MVTGESGGGKTCLLANFYFSLLENHPEIFCIPFFIGSTPQSASHYYLLQYLMQRLKEHLKIEEPVPTERNELLLTMENWLQLAAPNDGQRVSLVLILDALNQLDPSEQAADLAWLPSTFPSHVRVLVSSLPGRFVFGSLVLAFRWLISMPSFPSFCWYHFWSSSAFLLLLFLLRCFDVLSKRDVPMLVIKPLTLPLRKEVTTRYLKQYSKALDESQLSLITAAPQTGNPLYLRVLLDELRISANFAALNSKIRDYLEGKISTSKNNIKQNENTQNACQQHPPQWNLFLSLFLVDGNRTMGRNWLPTSFRFCISLSLVFRKRSLLL